MLPRVERRTVEIASHGRLLSGDLLIPRSPTGVVIFAHGSGESRRSPDSRFVANVLNATGFATLLLDLRTADEEYTERWARRPNLDLGLLSSRLISARRWVSIDDSVGGLPLGYFGTSVGAAAALIADAREPGAIRGLVSRSGRPDLAWPVLTHVSAPTLLMVGELDSGLLDRNIEALERLRCVKQLHVIRGATHPFDEPGSLDEVARTAACWFALHMPYTDAALHQ